MNQMDREKKKSPKKLKRKWKRGACSPESNGDKDPDQQVRMPWSPGDHIML